MTWPPPAFSELDGLAVFMAWFLPHPDLPENCLARHWHVSG
jgi:hypothetical protein